jgi:type VI secretion system secreted protein VgrG
VMVDFMHGDPDHPIVVGWVFNSSLKPVYPLPEHKTRSVWRTKRYKNAGSYPDAQALDTGEPGANEIRFEDKGGVEEVFLHAERDMNTRIRFEETHHVGATQKLKVGHNRTDDVGNDETTTIGKNQKLTVGGNQTEEIKANREVKVTSNDTLTVTGAQKIDVSQTITIKATQKITLECGQSKIELSPAGIKISSLNVESQGTVVNAVKSSVQVEISAGAMIKEQAGVIFLN